MADIESNIRFGVDTSDAIASIKMLQAQISAFQKQMASSSVANAESARKLRRGLIDDLNASGQWSASIKNIQSSSESFTNALEKNKLSMGEYFRYGASQVGGFRKTFTKEFNTIEKVARERVKDLQTQYISLGRDANGALKSIAVRPLKLDMENLATQTAINAQRQQVFNQLLKQGSTNLLNFGKNTQWAGRQLMVGFTIPLSIFGTMASKTFMELEQQAIRFKRVYGELFTPPEEADEMIDTLKELAKEFTKYGVAVEKTLGLAADAAAMGKTGVELLDQVTEANRLAVLGNVEQQQALETTISLTNAFGTATEDLAKKIDFLNAVENQTVVSIEDLTIAIPKAGPVVQQLGGDIEDLAFFLTAMKEGGINASEGANALKSGLASLINPTGQAANMLKVFGINIKEITAANRGDVKGLVVDFAKALDTLDPSQRAQAIEQLFGKFQFSRLSTLFQNVIQEGTQASRVLELTNATTKELAQLSSKELKRVEESTTFRFKKAIEEFNAAVAPVGEQFLKLITPIIEFATKIIEQFNSLSDGAKSFITGLTVLLGAVGPVALMTFGLLANGVANIIKGFTFVRELFQRTGKQSQILGEQFDYLTTEQLQAAAVSASLDQIHQTLIQTFSSEASAVKKLGDIYKMAFNEQQRFDTGRVLAKQAGLKLASGIVSVPGPKGAGDIVPAVLSPGEAVIPAEAAKKYAPIIKGMIAGNLPGFNKGVMLGMPRSGKGTQKDREAAEQVYAMFQQSSYANVPPRKYGHQLAKTSGHSFPIFGLGGVYMSPEGKKVFVKPVLDERAAVAEMRATEIARKAHGLKSPEQRIVVMQDPTDVNRQRKFLALESPLDPTFANNQPMALFNEEQYFRQLVASLLRVDKDLSASNVFGDVVADVGPAGVFTRASGLRDYADSLPSMEEQAMVNLLGIKGGAKRAFAESTLSLMAGLTPQQYQQKMVSEIQRVIPLLEQTISSFNLTDPREVKVYQDMVARLRQGVGVDWSKFHAIHSAVKPSQPKQTVAGYADGVVSVPGPKGKGDVVPAMLSPGEAVIPADKASKYAGLIQEMIYGKIPGYENSNVKRISQAVIADEFGSTARAGTTLNASHTSSFVPERAMGKLKAAMDLLGEEFEDTTVTVVEHTRAVDAQGKAITRARKKKDGSIVQQPVIRTETKEMPLSQALSQYEDFSMVTGGQAYGATAIMESGARNQQAFRRMSEVQDPLDPRNIGEIGSPETLKDVVYQGELAAKALAQFADKIDEAERLALENIIKEGQKAGEALSSTTASEQELEFALNQRRKGIELRINSDTGLKTEQQREAKRQAAEAKLTQIKEQYYREIAQGMSTEDALEKANARLLQLALKESQSANDPSQTLFVGGSDIASNILRGSLKKTSKVPLEEINPRPETSTGRSVGDAAANMVMQEVERLDLTVTGTAEELREFARNFVIKSMTAMEDGVVEGTRDFAQINSPSDRTDDTIGKPLVEGMEAGALSGKDDMQQAGAILAETAADSAAATASNSRRVTRPVTDTAKYSESQTGRPMSGNRRATREGDLEKRQREAAEAAAALGRAHRLEVQASVRSSNAMQTQARSAEDSASRMSSMNSMLMNGTFALSSLTGVLSMFGGEFAELNQTLFGVSTAMFALMQVTQMLTQAKILELAKRRFDVGMAASFGPKIGPKTLAQSATGFGATLLKAGKFVVGFLGPIGIATTLIAAFGGAVAFALEQEKKRKQAIEGLAKTANIASDQLDLLASEFGVTRNKVDFSSPASPSAQDDVAITPKDLAKNEDFLKKFETQIAGIKNATGEAASVALEGLSLQLRAEGFAPEAIKTITEGLLEAAGRTEVKLKFFKITATGDIELDVNVKQSANELIENYRKAFVDSEQQLGEGSAIAGANVANDFWASFWKNFALSQSSVGSFGPNAEFSKTTGELVDSTDGLTENARIRLSELTAYFTSAFSDIRAQLDAGSIIPAEYNLQLTTLFESLNALSDIELAPIVPALAESLGVTEEVDKVTNQIDKVLMLRAAVAGIPKISDEQIEALNKGGANAIKVRKELNKLIRDQAKELKNTIAEQEAEALVIEEYGTATAQLNDSIIALENQAEAYKLLTDAGYDAAVAFEYAGNAAMAAGIVAAAAAEDGGQKWRDLIALLNQDIELKKNAPKGPGGAGDKSDYQKTIESLQDQRKEIINNNIAFNKLRQAGFDTANAMKAAEDPITAAALASTKVGTDKWNNLISSIRQTQTLLSKKEIKDLLRGGKVEIADKKAQAVVSTALSRLGYTAEQLDEILSDQEFTNTLAKDLRDGSIDSQDLLNRLSQIKQLSNLDVVVNLTTKEGAAEEFQKNYDKVVGYLQAKQQTIEIGFQLKTEADRTIVREAEDLIAAIQYKIDDYEAELVGIEEQEEVINEKYNDRKEALDKIAKANDRIAKQQKGQLSLADALSKGDMAAAAQAVQDIRAQQAEDNVAGQGDLLEASKERELAAIRSASGKSRKQLEEEIKKLKKDIFNIEEDTLEPANERIRLAGVEKEAAVASLDAQILKWEELAAKVNEAKLKLTPEEMTAMQTQAGLIAGMLQNWDDIDSKTATLTIVKKVIGDVVDDAKPKPPVVPGDSGGGSGSDSGSPTSSNPTGGLSTAGFINRTDEGTLARVPGKPTSDAGFGKTWYLDSTTNTWRTVTSPKPPVNPGIGNTWYWDTFTDNWRIQPIAKPLIKAAGGSISGPGTSTSDSIPAMLSDGEFVVRASSVDKLGTGFLNFINQNGELPKFATGGFVSLQDRMAAAKKEENRLVQQTLARKEAEKLAARRYAADYDSATVDVEKPKPKPGNSAFYKPRTTSEAIGMGMQMVMDNITRGLFGQAGVNAKYGVNSTAGDVVDSVATVGLNALPIPGIAGLKAAASTARATAARNKEINLVAKAYQLEGGQLDLYNNILKGKLFHGDQNLAIKGQVPPKAGDYKALKNRLTTPETQIPNLFNADFFATNSRYLAGSYANRYHVGNNILGDLALAARMKKYAPYQVKTLMTPSQLAESISRRQTPWDGFSYNPSGGSVLDVRSGSPSMASQGHYSLAAKLRDMGIIKNEETIFSPKLNNPPRNAGIKPRHEFGSFSYKDTTHSTVRQHGAEHILHTAGTKSLLKRNIDVFATYNPEALGLYLGYSPSLMQRFGAKLPRRSRFAAGGLVRIMQNAESSRLEQRRKQVEKARALKASGVQFIPEDLPGGEKTIRAVRSGSDIGYINLMPPSERTNFKGAREIKMLFVRADEQRKGLGTTLFNEARKLRLNPIHSNMLSAEGKGFAEGLGGSKIPSSYLTNLLLSNAKAKKAANKASGEATARRIAMEKQISLTKILKTGEPSNNWPKPPVSFGRTANMGLGAMNVLGFLPTILEGGKIMQGTSKMLPKFEMYSMGGMVKPKYFNAGGMVRGYAMGGDIVPSMLTPGEFVMSKYAVQSYGLDKMKAINSGTYNGDSMYNYEINVNVQTDANADQIAKAVIGQIKHIDSQKIRGNRF